MIDSELADVALQRVSLLAFLYYPEIHVDEPKYSLNEDLDFCMEPLAELEEEDRKDVRQLFGRAIIDPSVYREEVFMRLTELTEPGTAEQ